MPHWEHPTSAIAAIFLFLEDRYPAVLVLRVNSARATRVRNKKQDEPTDKRPKTGPSRCYY